MENAINANTADTAGDGAGGYGTGTVANPAVTAADAGNGVINITANTTGTSSDFTATSAATGLAWNTGAGTNGVNAAAATPAVTNTWGYTVTIPAADLGGSATAPPVTLASGTLNFNGDGTLKSITPNNGSASLTNPTITIPPNGSTFADGANQLSFTWHLVNPQGVGLVTQEAAVNSTSSIQQDGAASGTLQNFSIGSGGIITGSFTNGTTAVVGQIALANFADEQGLSRTGDNDYRRALASGQATIGAPNSGGLGTLSGGALGHRERGYRAEFANLIVAQRSYRRTPKW